MVGRAGVGNSGGFSVVEVVVALGIMGVALAILIPRLSPQPRYFDADLQEFVDNLQVARQWAISRTTHYRLRVTSTSAYVIEQGVLSGSIWTFPTTARSVTLHVRIGFAAGDVGKAAEFSSRGAMVGTTLTFSVTNSEGGSTKSILVYPTGMVEIQ